MLKVNGKGEKKVLATIANLILPNVNGTVTKMCALAKNIHIQRATFTVSQSVSLFPLLPFVQVRSNLE